MHGHSCASLKTAQQLATPGLVLLVRPATAPVSVHRLVAVQRRLAGGPVAHHVVAEREVDAQGVEVGVLPQQALVNGGSRGVVTAAVVQRRQADLGRRGVNGLVGAQRAASLERPLVAAVAQKGATPGKPSGVLFPIPGAPGRPHCCPAQR